MSKVTQKHINRFENKKHFRDGVDQDISVFSDDSSKLTQTYLTIRFKGESPKDKKQITG